MCQKTEIQLEAQAFFISSGSREATIVSNLKLALGPKPGSAPPQKGNACPMGWILLLILHLNVPAQCTCSSHRDNKRLLQGLKLLGNHWAMCSRWDLLPPKRQTKADSWEVKNLVVCGAPKLNLVSTNGISYYLMSFIRKKWNLNLNFLLKETITKWRLEISTISLCLLVLCPWPSASTCHVPQFSTTSFLPPPTQHEDHWGRHPGAPHSKASVHFWPCGLLVYLSHFSFNPAALWNTAALPS